MKDTREHFKVSDIQKFSTETLIKSGYPETSAKATAHALLEADKRGIFSHGLAGGTGLEESVKGIGLFSTVDPTAEPEELPQKYPAIAVINAHGAPGHITSVKAVHLLEKLARKNGIAKVYVCEGNHFGAAGVWSEMIAAQGDLIGTVTCTTSALVKPMGDDPKGLDYTKGAGTEVRIGTNPIAVSVPHRDGIITIDMALTRMAANYCIKAYKTGEMLSIPEYAADKDYKSTLDPKEFIVREESGKQYLTGSIFPLGSTQAGYKGDALLRMIEVEHSVYGGPIEKLTVGEKKQRVSLAFQAQVVDCLYTKEEARNRVRELMVDYESKYFGEATRWPGDRSKEAYEYSMREGIPFSDGQIEMLKRAAAHVGLNFDEMISSYGRKSYPTSIFKK
ncbi:MAG: Ldh family oxidoreductase [Candidatus Heimdallarchaeota archaeon]|nr:Ldh family oxidoreductase [Candidatus Heimdallarchaeota archaeon]MBY8993764.1 Ldh family oxidoreductase [Candidatus Heimdallarchaeota archaeon]